MKRLWMILLICVYGCVASLPEEYSYTPPKLILIEPLPPFPTTSFLLRPELQLKFWVDTNGAVLNAYIITQTANAQWDSLSLVQIKRWKFTPAVYNGKPVRMWITLNAVIKMEQPVMMKLAEIACATKYIADSAYTLLQHGEEFRMVAERFSLAESRLQGGVLGEINVYRFPRHLLIILLKLGPGEITRPVLLGNQYMIYKRLAGPETPDS